MSRSIADIAPARLALLERLSVPGAHGPVTLANVASIRLAGGPAEIDRYDRLRNINFEIELNGQPLGEVEAKALALPTTKTRYADLGAEPVPLSTTEFKALLSTEGKRLSTLIKEQKIIVD